MLMMYSYFCSSLDILSEAAWDKESAFVKLTLGGSVRLKTHS